MEWKSISSLFFCKIVTVIWHSLRDVCVVSIKITEKIRSFTQWFSSHFCFVCVFFLLKDYFTLDRKRWKWVYATLNCMVSTFLRYFLFLLLLWWSISVKVFVWNACCHRRNSNAWIEEECNGYAGNQFLTIKMSMGFQQYLTTFLL